MEAPVFIARRQLLKNVHIACLEVILIIELVFKSEEKAVLIKIVIYDFLSEIDMHFIIHNK